MEKFEIKGFDMVSDIIEKFGESSITNKKDSAYLSAEPFSSLLRLTLPLSRPLGHVIIHPVRPQRRRA